MTEPSLRRELRLFDILAISLNGIIGTGIFFLPGQAQALMGPASVLGYLVAAALCLLLVFCFAEMGSKYEGTGGPMLYSRAAFGDTTGFFVGWITWLVRVISWAALAAVFADRVEDLVSFASEYRTVVLVGLFLVLATMNIAGVMLSGRFLALLTVVKLLPLLIFLVVGLFYIELSNFVPFAPVGFSRFEDTVVLILFAYVGFEAIVIPAGEMRDPKRNVPRALIASMTVVVMVYIGVWAVCTGTLSTLTSSENPVMEAAALFMGGGTWIITVGIFLSVLGINAGAAMVAPRSLYALSKKGYIPRFFGWVHPGTRTPLTAIVVTSSLSCCLALSNTFEHLVIISVVARFAQYIPTCIATMVMRYKKNEPVPSFRLPFGLVFPILATVTCCWLLSHELIQNPDKLLYGLVALLSGLALYLPVRVHRKTRGIS